MPSCAYDWPHLPDHLGLISFSLALPPLYSEKDILPLHDVQRSKPTMMSEALNTSKTVTLDDILSQPLPLLVLETVTRCKVL